jgi:pimeloyl-ACP methyl ester carboxylesterase
MPMSGRVVMRARTGASSASPDARRMLLRQKNLGFLLARVGFGEDPHPRHVEATRQMLAVCSRATLRDSSRALLALDLTGGLPNVTMPTLVIGGTRDAITPLRQSREIAELVPNARLEEFEGAGHMLMYERADDVDKLIIEFARECLV